MLQVDVVCCGVLQVSVALVVGFQGIINDALASKTLFFALERKTLCI